MTAGAGEVHVAAGTAAVLLSALRPPSYRSGSELVSQPQLRRLVDRHLEGPPERAIVDAALQARVIGA
jgi:hypothetical protein